MAKKKETKAEPKPTGTATVRLTKSQPALQNIPIKSELGKEIRKKFTEPITPPPPPPPAPEPVKKTRAKKQPTVIDVQVSSPEPDEQDYQQYVDHEFNARILKEEAEPTPESEPTLSEDSTAIAPSLYEPHVARISKSTAAFLADTRLKKVEQQLKDRNDRIEKELANFVITDPAGAQVIDGLLVQNKLNIKTVLALYNPIWEEAKTEYETVRGRRDEITRVQEAIENKGKSILRNWNDLQRERAEHEARLAKMEQIKRDAQARQKAQEEAVARAAAETQRLKEETEAKFAAELEAATTDEEINAVLAKYDDTPPVIVLPEIVHVAPSPVPVVASYQPKLSGNSSAEKWKAELDDKAVFLWNALGIQVARNEDGKLFNTVSKTLMPEPNEVYLDWVEVTIGKVEKAANVTKQHTNIPGVRVYRFDTIRTSTR